MYRVAFQGERGAYSEDAVIKHFGEAEMVPCRSLEEVFSAVQRGVCDYGMVPVENSFAGSINETYDLLLQYELVVCAEVKLAINHCLLGLPGQTVEDIVQVYSHPQALSQCADFLRKLGAETIAIYDTAGSAKMVSEKGKAGIAAIASSRAAQLYGLEVLARDIQTSPHNYTKFYVIAHHAIDPAPSRDAKYKTALVMATPDTPGALYRCLGALAERGVNLTKLESRPRRDKPWEYMFYVDCDGHAQFSPLKEALEELEARSSFLKILGSFQAASD